MEFRSLAEIAYATVLRSGFLMAVSKRCILTVELLLERVQ